jgi:hypothetical protein
MADKIALYTHNAYVYLMRNGVASEHLEAALMQCPVASRFNGAAYYYPDDLDAVIDVYLDHKAERAF